jgi:putative transposase
LPDFDARLSYSAVPNKVSFRSFKTSPEIIQLAVMLYVRFPRSLRNVEDLFHERGVDVSYEAVRYWWHRFWSQFAHQIKKRRAGGMQSSNWRWHLDEVFVKINGVKHYLWRAVDYDGEVLESCVTKKRDKKAALMFMKKAMRRHGSPNVIVTDKLRSYSAETKELGCLGKQVTERWSNNRVENSHLPFRRREQAMLWFMPIHSLQKYQGRANLHPSFPAI